MSDKTIHAHATPVFGCRACIVEERTATLRAELALARESHRAALLALNACPPCERNCSGSTPVRVWVRASREYAKCSGCGHYQKMSPEAAAIVRACDKAWDVVQERERRIADVPRTIR